MKELVKAADSLADSDIVSKVIRSDGEWSLVPNFGFLAGVYPAHVLKGKLLYPKFPEWLGKFSSTRKVCRELKELRVRMAEKISGSRKAL